MILKVSSTQSPTFIATKIELPIKDSSSIQHQKIEKPLGFKLYDYKTANRFRNESVSKIQMEYLKSR